MRPAGRLKLDRGMTAGLVRDGKPTTGPAVIARLQKTMSSILKKDLNMKKTLLLLAIPSFLVLPYGCAAKKAEQAEADMARPVDCATAEQDIATLEGEKASTSEQVASGVESIVPSAAVIGLLSGTYETNAKVAAGDYNQSIDAKVEEIKTECGMM